MRIKFYILWFEDASSWIKGKLNDVKEIIEGEGFEWVAPQVCKNESEFNGDFNDYDMILMDYALTDGKYEKTGVNIIERIRKKNIYTNILFYSRHGEDELREQIARKRLDGIFCANRDDFIDEFEALFLTIIKKTADINNLRGLVMAETADIDCIKEEIIELYDSIDCREKKKIKKSILKSMMKSNEHYHDILKKKDEDTPFKEIMELFDLSKKSRIIHNINHRIKGAKPICDFTHEKFDVCIIQKRNLLAHVKEKIVGTGKKKKIVLESTRGKLTFNHEEAKRIRNDLTMYKKELEHIRESLKTQKS